MLTIKTKLYTAFDCMLFSCKNVSKQPEQAHKNVFMSWLLLVIELLQLYCVNSVKVGGA